MVDSVDHNYWSTQQAAEEYTIYPAPYIPTAVSLILEDYARTHDGWIKNSSKVPLIVDVGCGSGQLTVPLSDHCERIIALDISEEQVTLGRRRNKKSNVEFNHCPASRLSDVCPEQAADLIVVGQAAHYFDNDQFFNEVKKCLKPNGVLAIVGFWNMGIEHEDERYQNIFTEARIPTAFDDFMKRGLLMLSQSYKTLYCPASDVKRREEYLTITRTKEEIKKYFMGVNSVFKGWEAVIDKTIDSLPPQEVYKTTMKIFGVFCRFNPS